MLDARGKVCTRQIDLLIDLGGLRLFQRPRGGLDLDDMRPQKRRHMGGIGSNIEGCLARLAETAAARIGPKYDGKAEGLRLGGYVLELYDIVGLPVPTQGVEVLLFPARV